MLNLACGYTTHPEWNNLDFSPYARLAHHPVLVRILRALGVLSALRYERLCNIDPDIIRWDLRNGIPFADGTLDLVYSSHFLEHLPKDAAGPFLEECLRVLRPGGVLRTVVPDLGALIDDYCAAVKHIRDGDSDAQEDLDRALGGVFDQMVTDEHLGTEVQHPVIRFVERCLRGDTSHTGNRHRWMYDEHSLGHLLRSAGFQDIRRCGAVTSATDGWAAWTLDTDDDGSERKPGSLYMEAVKLR